MEEAEGERITEGFVPPKSSEKPIKKGFVPPPAQPPPKQPPSQPPQPPKKEK